MNRSRRPSASGVLAFIALMVALGGTALAATGQLVNIADGTNAARIAKVDANGKLSVGVSGTVSQRELPPATPMRFAAGITAAGDVLKVATAPANKALIIKSLFLNTYANPSPGQSTNVQFYMGPTDGSPLAPIVAQINPTDLGLTAANVEPGIIVPSGQSLYADGSGSVQGLVFGFGSIVAAGSVPDMTFVTPAS
jgi:hypothetical protein